MKNFKTILLLTLVLIFTLSSCDFFSNTNSKAIKEEVKVVKVKSSDALNLTSPISPNENEEDNTNFLDTDSSNLKHTSFLGKYYLTQNKGKIDEFSSMVIGYSIEIKKDSVFFSGQGYQTNFYDLCRVKKDKDTLKLYYYKSLEGTDYNKNEKQPLVKLYKKGGDYYVKSPSIWVDAKPNMEIKFEKTD